MYTDVKVVSTWKDGKVSVTVYLKNDIEEGFTSLEPFVLNSYNEESSINAYIDVMNRAIVECIYKETEYSDYKVYKLTAVHNKEKNE